jgi:purine-binding chemotaxis protein CheW
MDFLEIRKRAKERARAREAEKAAAREKPAPAAEKPAPAAAAPEAPPPSPPGTPLPADAAVLTEDDVLQGALAARLQGLPEVDPGPAPDEGKFRTWRPGSGAPPIAPDPEALHLEHPAREADLVAGTVTAGNDPVSRRRPAGAPPPDRALRAPAAAPSTDPLDEFFYQDDEVGPALGELAAPGAAPEPVAPLLEREEFLTFLLGGEEFAVAIERVREVVASPPITEVPRAPTHILGVVTVRGEVVAVLDPRRRLGLGKDAPAGEGKIVILDAGEGPAGLKVDRIASVVRLRPGSIEPCPQGIAGERAEFIAGIGRENDRLFTVLDVPALLRRAPPQDESLPRRHDA